MNTLSENRKIVLEGIVGSQAYGLATPESDTDLRGAFVYPTEELLHLVYPDETVEQTMPDVCHHEVRKLLRLAAQNNPNILEIFWLDTYTQLTDEGKLLLNLRDKLFSQRVRQTYGGYAMAQMKRLKERGDGSFKSKLRKRREKHARHCFRLLFQGQEILETGKLTVNVSDKRDELFAYGKLPDDELVAQATEQIKKLDSMDSVLPVYPDLDAINDTLLTIRKMNASS